MRSSMTLLMLGSLADCANCVVGHRVCVARAPY